MNPGKTYLPDGIDHFGIARRVDVAIDARDRFAFAKDIGDVALARRDDFAAL